MGRESVFLPTTASTTVNPVAAPPTSLAPGFRFHPTDEELVIYYLKRKVSGKPFRFDAISEVDIYRSEPGDLADKSRLKTRDQEWYFFSALDKKYGNGGRMNRATGKGYWKATGNDRQVKHEERVVGLKKTLVFHSGRAPDGKRTNWVMHEYRLTEKEMERIGTGSSQPQDAYVLCRVFHKNNIGPPNGQRYAPFIEEEWDDAAGMVPGVEPVDNGYVAHQPRVEGNGVLCTEVVQDTQSMNKAPFDVNKLPIETQNLLAVCKRESMAEYPSPEQDDNNCKHVDEDPSPQTDNPKPFSQIYKRRRHNLNSNHSNVSGDAIQGSQDLCSSTISTNASTLSTTTAAATTTNTVPKKHFLSALVEYSLLESLESKESLASIKTPDFDTQNLESSMPPNCAKFIKQLQSEMQKLSVEKETMRFEMMSAQATINILQSRVDILSKENEELKRLVQNP
ncbi:NAC domain containing protein 50 isoform X1 [Cajanus cajan]|uniref:NAC domain containing protein 50 isoform X1 n=1 Tax=Cajanus cajan TaxID=3821 RepID=UPI00098DA96F|nr:NAC domain containing protein 50 isoform X1 [Cajanus cajan]